MNPLVTTSEHVIWSIMIEWLREDTVAIEFEKADGTKRIMLATLYPEYIDYEYKKNSEVESNKIETPAEFKPSISVWDMEKLAWRRVTRDRINKIKHLNDETKEVIKIES